MITATGHFAGGLFVILTALFLLPNFIFAHCDTMDGPVVAAARIALEKGDVTPVLKWIREADEQEIREAFARTLAVRKGGPEARKMADMYFFETLMRVHRAGEGAPYTGIKPAGYPVEREIVEADRALDAGRVDELVKMLAAEVEQGIRSRFTKVLEVKKHAEESVAQGREFVAAYVDYVHFVEGLHGQLSGAAGHEHGQEGGGGAHHEH